jgi:hypothetical protein
MFAHGNTHVVIPGRVYRSAQLSGNELRDFIRAKGIRTVVNLRGCCAGFDWYSDECRITSELKVSQEDITFSANRLPPPAELRRLIEVFDRAEYPILLHCRQGADRTGLASVAYLLLHSDADLPAARRQCSPRYAHFPVLSTAAMDRFFDMYEEWLSRRSEPHSPDRFRQWACREYQAPPAPARLELLGEMPTIATGEALSLRLRATNLSNVDWQFKPGTFAGIYGRYTLQDQSGAVLGVFQAGRFDRRVAPGEAIDLDLPFPPFHRAGVYRVTIDLADHHVTFGQIGSDWLDLEIGVTDKPGK